MLNEESGMVKEKAAVVLAFHWFPPNYLDIWSHRHHHHGRTHEDRCHDRWDAARSRHSRQRISLSSRKYPIFFQTWLVSWSPIDLRPSFDSNDLRFRDPDTSMQSESFLEKSWIWLTAPRSSRLGPPCLAKCLSCVGSMSFLPVRSDDTGAAGHTILRSNSRSARGVSHCRDRLSQKELGVLCRCWFSSFRRLVVGGDEESFVGSASIHSCRFRLRGIGVFSGGIEPQSYETTDSARLPGPPVGALIRAPPKFF